jgi:GWxTD domain-containing protein
MIKIYPRITSRFLIPVLALLFAFQVPAQVTAYYNSCVFNTPGNQPFIETHLTIIGKSLFAKQEDDHYRNSVNVKMQIYRDTQLVKVNKYNIIGPAFSASNTALPFIDNQRYSLPNGEYTLILELIDNHNPSVKSFLIKDEFHVNFLENEAQMSSIQALESYSKAPTTGPLTKSGFDLVPYNVNYYPESSDQLTFYVEAYNAEKFAGPGRPVVFSYFLETENHTRINSVGSFKKQNAAAVNPLIGKLDISKIGTNNYYLVVELKDETNTVLTSARYFFQRVNHMVEITTLQHLSMLEQEAEYFGHCKNLDTLKMFVECLWPIADGLDKERVINTSLTKNASQMKKYVIDFWERRAADTANPIKMWAAYYKQVQTVMALFHCGKQKGYYSDRGRVYLQYGPPSQRSQQSNEANTFPYEIWQYYRTTDQTNGQFFSNRKFVFVNKMMGDDCHQLIHSDMRGEINNPRWQFELTRRNNNGLANPDNTTPANTEYNQFNDIYSSPR